MNLNEITMGLNPQEKEMYFRHQEKRNKEEQEKIRQEKEHLRTYKECLINDILRNNDNFTKEELQRKSIRVLERIF